MLVLIIPWYIVYVFIEILAGARPGHGRRNRSHGHHPGRRLCLPHHWLSVVMKVSPTIPAIIFSYPVTWIVSALAFVIYYIWRYFRNRKEARK